MDYWSYKGDESVCLARIFPANLISFIGFPLELEKGLEKKEFDATVVNNLSVFYSGIQHEFHYHGIDLSQLATPFALSNSEKSRKLISNLRLSFESSSYILSKETQNATLFFLKELIGKYGTIFDTNVVEAIKKVDANTKEEGDFKKFSTEIESIAKTLYLKLIMNNDSFMNKLGFTQEDAKKYAIKRYIISEINLRWNEQSPDPWSILNIINEATNKITNPIQFAQFQNIISTMCMDQKYFYYGFLPYSAPENFYSESILASELIHNSDNIDMLRLGCHLLNIACPPSVLTYFIFPSRDLENYELTPIPPLTMSARDPSMKLLENIPPALGYVMPSLAKLSYLLKVDDIQENIERDFNKWAFGLIDNELLRISNALDDPRGINTATALDMYTKGINDNFSKIHDPIEFLINYRDDYRMEFLAKADKIVNMYFYPPYDVSKMITGMANDLVQDWKKAI